MVYTRVSWLIVAGGLALQVSGQNAPRTPPIPSDPLETVIGPVRVVKARAPRAAALQLLDRARSSYGVRSAGRGYDLKVTFTVNSGGQTEYDGAWEMEDMFDPQLGLRWTARSSGSSGSYAITRISSLGMLYGDDTASYVPLRLQEVRAALFDPIPSSGNVKNALVRTSTATFTGAQLTCVLLSSAGKSGTAAPGRRWDETEECIDPQSGLLRVHSQIPGRYYAYDYANAPQLDGHVLPRRVTVTEAGKIVTEISVDSLTELPAADPSLFVPSDEMKAKGRAIALVGSQKFRRVLESGFSGRGATVQPVCVFGVVTPTGELAEAHSLQPWDPNSQTAVEAARQMTFPLVPSSPIPQQHFVFVIVEFVSP